MHLCGSPPNTCMSHFWLKNTVRSAFQNKERARERPKTILTFHRGDVILSPSLATDPPSGSAMQFLADADTVDVDRRRRRHLCLRRLSPQWHRLLPFPILPSFLSCTFLHSNQSIMRHHPFRYAVAYLRVQYLQICRKISGLGCVTGAMARTRFTQPSTHIFLHFFK